MREGTLLLKSPLWFLQPQMTDYLSEYGVKLDAKPAKKGKRRRKLHVLLYGDSIDRVMLEDICEIGGGVRQQCWVDPKSAPRSEPALATPPLLPSLAREWTCTDQ